MTDIADHETVVRVKAAIAEALGSRAMDCKRTWSAWSYGTMGEEDFVPIINDDERLTEITMAAIEALAQKSN